MVFTMVAEALLHARLPEAPCRPLLSKFGYSVGFLVVILGRQQLFTKNTLTVILPMLRLKKGATVTAVAELWEVVLLANLVGAFAFGWLAAHSGAFSDEAKKEFANLAKQVIQ